MRIIAGEFRGRRLLDPADRATRPVTDRVKQSLFDVLGDRVATAAQVYDVFAGTGSFGLEALSRGAGACTFLERHRPAVDRLRRNIETLGLAARAVVITQDVFRLPSEELAALPPAEVIFFDPPYPLLRERAEELKALLEKLAGNLRPGGCLVFRHEKSALFPTTLPAIDDRTWGSMRVRFLGAAPAAGGAEALPEQR